MYRILIKYRDNGVDSLYKYLTETFTNEDDEETESYVEYADEDSLREGIIEMLNNGYALSDFAISGVVECTVDTLTLSGVGIEDTNSSDDTVTSDTSDETNDDEETSEDSESVVE